MKTRLVKAATAGTVVALLLSMTVGADAASAAPGDSASALPTLFVSPCRLSHTAPDDPIVHPGEPGASHLHEFFGSSVTAASSTTTQMRTGATSCQDRGDTAGYWIPALQVNGQVVHPTVVRAYYLLAGKNPAAIQPFPADLAMLAGAVLPVKTSGPAIGPNERPARWLCRSLSATADEAPSLTPPTCPSGTDLVERLAFPDCWDGQHTDSADHRSHMAYSQRGSCPADHPIPVPQLLLAFHWRNVPSGRLTLSSGDTNTAHADFLNGWHQDRLTTLVGDCLNANVHCGPSARV